MLQQDFSIDELKARRHKLCEAIGEGAVALIQGARGPKGSGLFRQYNDFYYLCGVETPGAYLLVNGAKERASVFLPRDLVVSLTRRHRPRDVFEPSLFALPDQPAPGAGGHVDGELAHLFADLLRLVDRTIRDAVEEGPPSADGCLPALPDGTTNRGRTRRPASRRATISAAYT